MIAVTGLALKSAGTLFATSAVLALRVRSFHSSAWFDKYASAAVENRSPRALARHDGNRAAVPQVRHDVIAPCAARRPVSRASIRA